VVTPTVFMERENKKNNSALSLGRFLYCREMDRNYNRRNRFSERLEIR